MLIACVLLAACGSQPTVTQQPSGPFEGLGSINSIAVFPLAGTSLPNLYVMSLSNQVNRAITVVRPDYIILSAGEISGIMADTAFADEYNRFASSLDNGRVDRNSLDNIGKGLGVDLVFHSRLSSIAAIETEQGIQARVSVDAVILNASTAETIWQLTAYGQEPLTGSLDDNPRLDVAIEAAMDEIIAALGSF